MKFLELYITLLVLSFSEAIMFHLQAGEHKCLKEEIHKDVLVSGEYSVQEIAAQKVDLKVRM